MKRLALVFLVPLLHGCGEKVIISSPTANEFRDNPGLLAEWSKRCSPDGQYATSSPEERVRLCDTVTGVNLAKAKRSALENTLAVAGKRSTEQ